MPHIKRLEGQQFGFLTVTARATFRERSGRGGREVWWLADCRCGKQVSVRSKHLLGGLVVSCGCMGSGRKMAPAQHPAFTTWMDLRSRGLLCGAWKQFHRLAATHPDAGDRGYVLRWEGVMPTPEDHRWERAEQ